MNQFIFCHGFGFDKQFWQEILPYFSQEKCFFMDLGYFNNPVNKQDLGDQKIIGIGHSIGLSKLISMYSNFDCLVGLNGFVNFLGSNEIIHKKRQKELAALKLNFLKKPKLALKYFYKSCGANEFFDQVSQKNLDLDLILDDFRWLEQKYSLPQVPTLILSSDNDIIVPNQIISDNFAKIPNVKSDIIADGCHILGLKKPSVVYNKIMSFLDEYQS